MFSILIKFTIDLIILNELENMDVSTLLLKTIIKILVISFTFSLAIWCHVDTV